MPEIHYYFGGFFDFIRGLIGCSQTAGVAGHEALRIPARFEDLCDATPPARRCELDAATLPQVQPQMVAAMRRQVNAAAESPFNMDAFFAPTCHSPRPATRSLHDLSAEVTSRVSLHNSCYLTLKRT